MSKVRMIGGASASYSERLVESPMQTSRLLPLAALIALGSCGHVAELKPPTGKALPVKPLMAKTAPDARELLTPPPYARPNRVDELIRQPRERQPDPFDLPPPTGGVAPSLPAGSDPQPVTNETGPSTPGD
jgi:hypothetical protein